MKPASKRSLAGQGIPSPMSCPFKTLFGSQLPWETFVLPQPNAFDSPPRHPSPILSDLPLNYPLKRSYQERNRTRIASPQAPKHRFLSLFVAGPAQGERQKE